MSIHELAKSGNSKAIQKEIENYRKYTLDIVPELNKKDKDGKTPLFIAVERNDLKTINVLLSVEGIDVNCTGNNNINPLHVAVKINNIKAVFALLKRGANVDAKDMQGNTPLFYAVNCIINAKFIRKNKATDILELLLLKIANVNIQNKEGNTPLHIAAQSDNVKLLQILLRFNATAAIKNKMGVTSLDLARLNRNSIMAAILAKRSVSAKLAGLDKILTKINKKIMKDLLRISRKVIGVNLGGVTELSLNKLQSILFTLSASDYPSSAPLLYNPTSIISISPLSTHNFIKEWGDANSLTTKTLLISETIDRDSLENANPTTTQVTETAVEAIMMPTSQTPTLPGVLLNKRVFFISPVTSSPQQTQAVESIESIVSSHGNSVMTSSRTSLPNRGEPMRDLQNVNREVAKILSNSKPKSEPISNHKDTMVKVNVRERCAFFSNKASQQQVKKPEVINASRSVQGPHKENDSSRVIETSRKLR